MLTGDKVLRPVSGKLAQTEALFTGYEMHLGRTTGNDLQRPFLFLGDTPDGATSAGGRVAGTYVHGLFNAGSARAAFLKYWGAASDGRDHATVVDRLLDDIAQELDRALDIKALSAIAGIRA